MTGLRRYSPAASNEFSSFLCPVRGCQSPYLWYLIDVLVLIVRCSCVPDEPPIAPSTALKAYTSATVDIESNMAGLPGSSDLAGDGRGHDGHNTIRRIAVFCGASSGNSPEYIECAKKMGQEMVKRGIGLVYGGEHPHVMMKSNQSCPVLQGYMPEMSESIETQVSLYVFRRQCWPHGRDCIHCVCWPRRGECHWCHP